MGCLATASTVIGVSAETRIEPLFVVFSSSRRWSWASRSATAELASCELDPVAAAAGLVGAAEVADDEMTSRALMSCWFSQAKLKVW